MTAMRLRSLKEVVVAIVHQCIVWCCVLTSFYFELPSIMDIFNRPPAISEDTLQYTIYPAQNLSDRAAVTTFAACLIDYVDILLPGHIWHRDAFEVKVVPHPEAKDSWILEGRMRVGDSVDDEWCTVWLLKEISSKWDLVIRWAGISLHVFDPSNMNSVFDSDGEFLLIEAAEVLPLWVQPKNSENRVRPSTFSAME